MPAAERNFSVLRHGNAVSFTKTLNKGCPPGSSIEIIAKTLKIWKRHIAVRLIAFDDTALILTVPIGKEGKVTASARIDGNSTSELEKRASLPRDKKFNLELKFTKFTIEININKILLLEFIHRVEPESITELHIDGPLKLEEVVLSFPQDERIGAAAPQSDSTREVEGTRRSSPPPLTPEPAAVQTGSTISPTPADPPPSYEADTTRNSYISPMYPIAFFTPLGIMIQQPLLGDPAIAALSEQVNQANLSYSTQNILTSQVEERRNIGRWATSTTIIPTETATNLTNLFISMYQAIAVTPKISTARSTWPKTFNIRTPIGEENQIVSALQNIDLQVQVINREAPALMNVLKRIYSEHAKGKPPLLKRNSSRPASTTMRHSVMRNVATAEEVQGCDTSRGSRAVFDSVLPARPPSPPPRSRSLNPHRIENYPRSSADGSNSSISRTSSHENIIRRAATSTPASGFIIEENLRGALPNEAVRVGNGNSSSDVPNYAHEDLSRFETPILTASSADQINTKVIRDHLRTSEMENSHLYGNDLVQEASSAQEPSHQTISANGQLNEGPSSLQNDGQWILLVCAKENTCQSGSSSNTPENTSLTKNNNDLTHKFDKESERLKDTANVAHVTNRHHRKDPDLQSKASALMEDLKKRMPAALGVSEVTVANVPVQLRSVTSSAESGLVPVRESRFGEEIAIEVADIRGMISKQL
ncbi:unnamed protein product [Cylicocyclus nassatus]|uniref:Galectin domain-containing protein n=1 Tax=Cylicocyclus nassatus TaxID=53992 RepID=A0AA36GR56_CYLNA|nr:unnamed protein product [Cylicocyclus nassatus]